MGDERSFSDWESVHDDEEDSSTKIAGVDDAQIVVEFPPGGISEEEHRPPASTITSPAACFSSFSVVNKINNNNINLSASVSGSTASDWPQIMTPSSCCDESLSAAVSSRSVSDGSLLTNFDILSLSGETIMRCKRCKFHNPPDSTVCGSCALALVANPSVSIDEQIALHLQQKEKQDAMLMFHDKHARLRDDPLLAHATVLTQDIRSLLLPYNAGDDDEGGFDTFDQDDLEGWVLQFIQNARDLPRAKVSLAYKCTSKTSLEAIRKQGFPVTAINRRHNHYRRVGGGVEETETATAGASTGIEVSSSMEDALLSFNDRQGVGGDALFSILENRDSTDLKRDDTIGWIVAVVESIRAPQEDTTTTTTATTTKEQLKVATAVFTSNDTTSTTGTAEILPCATPVLPLIFFDWNTCDSDKIRSLLSGLRRICSEFFVAGLDMEFGLMSPPPKKARATNMEHHSNETGNIVVVATDTPTTSITDVQLTESVQQANERMPAEKKAGSSWDYLVGIFGEKGVNQTDESSNTTEGASSKRRNDDTATLIDMASAFNGECSLTSRVLVEHRQQEKIHYIKAVDRVWAVAISGKTLAIGCNDWKIYLWEEACGHYKTLEGHRDAINCLAFDPTSNGSDDRRLASGDRSGVIRIWNSGRDGVSLLLELDPGDRKPIVDFRFFPSGNTLASANWGRRCRLWRLADGACRCNLQGKLPKLRQKEGVYFRQGESFPVNAAAFSPDGLAMASVANGSSTIYFWKFNRGGQYALNGHKPSLDAIGREDCQIRALSFSPDGSYLASAANDLTIRIWTLRDEAELGCHKVINIPAPLSCLVYSPDGKLLAGGGDCVVQLWNVETGVEWCVHTLSGRTGSVKCLAFFPDGKTLVSSGANGTVHFWTIKT